ncbi:hypothetical protein AAF712_008920 [Marasmius tenuissimus]|uniref:F-box domain-containing protein n=1 Tax=Marasmius tenuissimus TaxID=585030 RepID=A0ABR2ZS44_9AGAR
MRDLPLDLVYEICSHLEPFDLLRLSRASRELRRMLLTKASQSMWRRARANSGIPEPIGSMSEPAFASLVFEAHCSFCFAPNVRNISWLAQRRVCKKCIEKYFDVQHTFIITKTLSIPSPLWKTVPRCWLKMASWGGIQVGEGITIGYYLTSAVEDVAKEYAATPASQREAWIEEKVKIGDAVNQTRFPNAMESDLSACTSLFNCASCIRGGCQCHGLYSLDSSFATTVPEWYKTGDFPVVWPSSLTNVKLCTKGIDRAQEVARLLDMDPSKTPASTMLTLNPFVECISCGTPEEKWFLRWTSVVAHGAHKFRAVSQKHAEIVKKLEEKIIPNIRRNENSQEHELALENNFMRHDKRLVAFCKRCGYRDHEEDEIKRHVTQSHGASVVSAQDWEFVAFGPLCFRGVRIKGDARLFLS